MTDTEALPSRNLFLLLDLDPRSLWNRGTIESALAEFEASIELVRSRTGSDAPTEQELQILDNLWAAVLDPELRQRHASMARVHWTTWQDCIGELNATLADLTAKGYVSESEIAMLHSRFSDLPGRLEVDRRLLEQLAQAPPPSFPPRYLTSRPEQQAEKQAHHAAIALWSHGRRGGGSTPSRAGEKPARRDQEGPRPRTPFLIALGAALIAILALALVLFRLDPLSSFSSSSLKVTVPIVTASAVTTGPVPSGGTSVQPLVTQAIRRSTRAWEIAMQCACSEPLDGSESGSALAGDRHTVAALQERDEHLVVIPTDPQVTAVTEPSTARVIALAHRGRIGDLYKGNRFQAHCGAISTMLFTLQQPDTGWIVTAVRPQRLCPAL